MWPAPPANRVAASPLAWRIAELSEDRTMLRAVSRWYLILCVLLFAAAPALAQDDDDQGWSQFTRNNTLRATVTAAAPAAKGSGSFEVKTDSGQQWKVLYGPNTRFIRDRQPAKAADIHLGDMLFAAGDLDEKKKTIGAAVLIGIDGAEVQKAREGLGKTWSAGKITSVSGTHIMVQRLDGVSQTISVDENTSFKQHHDSVTLADVKPGEGFRAEGHVQEGVFVASTLNVFNLDGHEPWLDAGTEAGRASPRAR
jgi:uncharacterized protein DUF5666